MAAMIGTRSRARSIQRWYDEGRWDKPLPKGWRLVGNGGSRNAYLHIESGVVYKVESFNYNEDYANSGELTNARRLLRKCRRNDQWYGAYVRIPKTSGFQVDGALVIAMEFIEGTLGFRATNSHPSARAELHSIGFSDMHGYNYIVDADGVHWPIDMGSPLPDHPDWEGADARALQGAV